MVVEIDIPNNNKISAIGINVLTSMNSYITLPERIELYDISEGKDILISYKNIPKEDSFANTEIKMFSIPLINKNISKIKLIVKSFKSHLVIGVILLPTELQNKSRYKTLGALRKTCHYHLLP